jgi:hypothetical protein
MANAAVTRKLGKQACHVATQAFFLAWLGELRRPATQEILGLINDWNGSHGGKLLRRTDNFGVPQVELEDAVRVASRRTA